MKTVLEKLRRLNELLDAIPPERGGMTIGEFDGYVTAIVVCPERVLPAEWLPAIWGAEGGCAEAGEADGIAAAALEHYKRIASELAREPDSYAPVMATSAPDGPLLWRPWINGFERALRLRSDAWEKIALSDDEEAAASLDLIRAMSGLDGAESELTVEAEDELDRIMPELIHSLVLNLYASTRSR